MTVVTWETVRRQAAIAGRVTDAQTGKGVGGALVQIASGPPEFTYAIAVSSTQHGARWATMVERLDQTRAAGDGHFHFTDLSDGLYRVTSLRAIDSDQEIRRQIPGLSKRGFQPLLLTEYRDPDKTVRPKRFQSLFLEAIDFPVLVPAQPQKMKYW